MLAHMKEDSGHVFVCVCVRVRVRVRNRAAIWRNPFAARNPQTPAQQGEAGLCGERVLMWARAVLAHVLGPVTPPADCDSQASSAEAGGVCYSQDSVVGILLARPR